MIRQEMCYTDLNVKIACSHGGVTPANDGASHQAIEDMGWKYDSDEGNQGDCGPKHEYTKTVNHRKLHLYVKTCDGSNWYVSKDRFLFHVEYN